MGSEMCIRDRFKVPKLQKNFAAGKEQFDREWGAVKEFLEN